MNEKSCMLFYTLGMCCSCVLLPCLLISVSWICFYFWAGVLLSLSWVCFYFWIVFFFYLRAGFVFISELVFFISELGLFISLRWLFSIISEPSWEKRGFTSVTCKCRLLLRWDGKMAEVSAEVSLTF